MSLKHKSTVFLKKEIHHWNFLFMNTSKLFLWYCIYYCFVLKEESDIIIIKLLANNLKVKWSE